MGMTGRGENQVIENKPIKRPAVIDCVIIIALLVTISVVGFWLPHPIKELLIKGAAIISGNN